MARLDTFLELVVTQRASDLHFHAGKRPHVRLDGELVPLPFRVLTQSETRSFVLEVLEDEHRKTLQREQQIDFVYPLPGIGRFRVNVCEQTQGLSAVFRVIGEEVASLDELGLPLELGKLADSASGGLILVTGPTGSGKSTTLAAMIRHINERRQRHIITIEDPIEYVHTSLRSLVTQREVGRHATSFAQALRSALREAADVIVVGELRDAETIELALSAAETGILVFGTLHTCSAPRSVARMLEVFDGSEQEEIRGALSLVLKGVVAQSLVRRRRGGGRIAALEILRRTEAVAHMIRADKVFQLGAYLESQGREEGMIHLDADLARLVRQGLVTIEDAERACMNPERFRRRFAG